MGGGWSWLDGWWAHVWAFAGLRNFVVLYYYVLVVSGVHYQLTYMTSQSRQRAKQIVLHIQRIMSC